MIRVVIDTNVVVQALRYQVLVSRTSSAATVQNSQCTLNGSGSSATMAGNTLTLNASLTFKPAFAGAKTVFIFAYTATANTGFQTGGTWTSQ